VSEHQAGWAPPAAPASPGGVDTNPAPPSWPAPGAVYEADVTLARPGRKRRGLLAAVVAVALLLAGLAVTVMVLRQDDGGGAGNPQDAVTGVIDSLEKGDLLGVLDGLAPSERDVIRDYVQDSVKEGKRLGLLDENVDLSNVPGLGFSADGLRTSVERVTDDIANVALVGGTVRIAPDVSALPYGAAIDRFLEATGGKPEALEPEEVDLASLDQPPLLTAVREDGRWYASIAYTIAEDWRANADAAAPDPKGAIGARGAASPEAAVEALLAAVGDSDAKAAIEVLDPREMQVLHDYGSLIPEASGGDGQDLLKVKVVDWKWERADVRGGVKVIPTKVVVEGEVAFGDGLFGEITGEATKMRITLERTAGPCVQWRFERGADVEEDNACAADLREALVRDAEVPPEVADIAIKEVSALATVGIVTVQRDGQWFVSPLRTLGDLSLVQTKALTPQDIDTLTQAISDGLFSHSD